MEYIAVVKDSAQIGFQPCFLVEGFIYSIEQIFHTWVHFLRGIKMSGPSL